MARLLLNASGMQDQATESVSASPAQHGASRGLLTAGVVLLCVVALLQLALLLQRHLSYPSRTKPAPAVREMAWSPEDEIAEMHARINRMFDQAFAAPFSSHPSAATVSPQTDGGSTGSSATDDPFTHMRQMQQRIDALFNSSVNSRMHQPAGFDDGWARLEITPGFSVSDTGDSYEITVQLPGVDKSGIHIVLDREVLGLTVEQDTEHSSHTRSGTSQQERHRLRFERHLRLPGATGDKDAVTASYDKDVLRITVPKKAQKETPAQNIPIH